MGFQFNKRPSAAPGIRDLSPSGQQATTKLTFSGTVYSTGVSISDGFYLGTSGTVIANRVVKMSSAGNWRHTTGTSGRLANAVLYSTGSTALGIIRGIVQVMASSAAIKRGARLVASSGSVQTSRFNGGCVRAVNTGIASTLQHGHCLGFAITSAAASSNTVRKIFAYFNPMGRVSTGV